MRMVGGNLNLNVLFVGGERTRGHTLWGRAEQEEEEDMGVRENRWARKAHVLDLINRLNVFNFPLKLLLL